MDEGEALAALRERYRFKLCRPIEATECVQRYGYWEETDLDYCILRQLISIGFVSSVGRVVAEKVAKGV